MSNTRFNNRSHVIREQRERLAQYGEWLKKPCAVADKVLDGSRYMRAHPWTAGAATALAAALGRRHVFRWAGYTWRAWRFVGARAREMGFIKSL